MVKFVNPESLKTFFKDKQKPKLTALEILKYIGPGLLVTVGFIDPGNWASNVASGSVYGYSLLWVVTLSTIMLIFLQHNSAHLGIVTGYCLSESASIHLKPWISKFVLVTSVFAVISTALAEILGAAIALNMLFHIPLKIGGMIILVFVSWMLYSNSYKKLERWIIGFVSIIGISFIIELCLVKVAWGSVLANSFVPSFPKDSMPIIMSVLGAVVMPHNLYLHSEIIQSRQWNLEDETVIKRQLKYEFADTLFSMTVGWAINLSMMIVAAATFFAHNMEISELGQAQAMLKPMLGDGAAIIFAVALLFAGVSSSVTAGMAGGSIVSGMFKEPYDINDKHSKLGVGISLVLAAVLILFIRDPFKGLVYSQMFLSIQLPVTIFAMVYLTSSKKVMGTHVNAGIEKYVLWIIGIIVTILNILLFKNMLGF